MSHRRLRLAAAAAMAFALTACAPQQAPEPTPTGFASEEEAYAAAEETYRAYVDALNGVDLSEPATFEPLYSLTTGEANEEARQTFSEMHANGWTVEGPTVIQLIEGDTNDKDGATALNVCLDVSGVSVVDSDGQSVVDSNRKDVQSMRIEFSASAEDPRSLRMSAISGREGEPTCAN